LEEPGAEVQSTPVVTIDDYCRGTASPASTSSAWTSKGAEQKALAGALEVLDRDRPHVLVEIHPAMLEGRFRRLGGGGGGRCSHPRLPDVRP